MKLKKTSAIGDLLEEAVVDPSIDKDVRALAQGFMDEDAVDWDGLKCIADAVTENRTGHDPVLLHQVCRGSSLILEPPPKRPKTTKSPELQAHFERLRRKLEQDQYNAMVSDVTGVEDKALAASEGGLATYKQQMSFGIHVIVMMGAFYGFGFIAGTALTSNKAYHPAIGMGFMIFAMLLETILFVIRTTVPPKLHDSVIEVSRPPRHGKAATPGDGTAPFIDAGNSSLTNGKFTADEVTISRGDKKNV